MAGTSTNLGLTLPVGAENVSRQVINDNMNIIDGAVGAIPVGKTLQGQIDDAVNDVGTLETEVGNTPLPTTAQTITGAIAEHESDISDLVTETTSQKADFDNLKSAISEQTRNLWEFGNQSFTKSKTVVPNNIPAGTYTFSAEITSQLSECRVAFYYESSGSYPNINIQLTPNTTGRVSGSVTLPGPCVQIILYSGASASASTGYTASYTDIQIEAGESESAYIPFLTATDFKAREEIEKTNSDIAEIDGDITGINTKINSMYKATRNLWTRGDSSNSNKDFTGLSYPVAQYTLSLKASGNESSFKWYAYSANHQVGSGDIVATSGRQSFVVNPNEPIVRMYFNCPSGTTVTEIQFEKRVYYKEGYSESQQQIYFGTYPYATDYIAPYVLEDPVSREMLNHWNGKTIDFNGDSITEGAVGEHGEDYAYVNTVKSIIQFDRVNNYAISGSRFARDPQDDKPPLIDRYTRMDTSADIVFIMMNTNDYASQVPIGTDDSTDPETYKGAMNIVFSWLRENFAGKQIIISTMPTRKINNIQNTATPLPITIEEYRQAVIDMVRKYKFILYDAYLLLGMNWEWEFEYHKTTGVYFTTMDGLHPNEIGAEIMGRKIAEFIMQQ